LNSFAETNSWLEWQLIDSAFPTGGFAHSGGLEAAWQHGEIRNADELRSFLESNIWQLSCGFIPILMEAHGQSMPLAELDEVCDVFLSNHVANRASRSQGRAFFNSVRRIFSPALNVPEEWPCFHFAPVYGAVARALDLELSRALELFAFQSLRGWVSAAIRLGIIGPMAGQALQFQLAPQARQIIAEQKNLSLDEIASVNPLLEIWQGSQDRLYSRLFQS
jgi:urease accessory protein